MAINPDQINLIDLNGLTSAFNLSLDAVVAVQNPGDPIIYQTTIGRLAQLIAGDVPLPDGVINGLGLTFNNGTTPKTVSVSAGQWRINNTVYTSNVPVVYNVSPASETDRTDAILADDSGLVYYQRDYNGTLPNSAILVSTFVVKADGSDIGAVTPTPVLYAVMNGLNSGDFNITGQYLINGVPFEPGSSSAPVLKFAAMATFDGGDIELAGLVDDNGVPVPESGVKLVTKAAYVGSLDISQSLTYNPDTQVLSTGYENSTIYLLLTFEQTGTTPTFTRYGLSAPLSYGLT